MLCCLALAGLRAAWLCQQSLHNSAPFSAPYSPVWHHLHALGPLSCAQLLKKKALQKQREELGGKGGPGDAEAQRLLPNGSANGAGSPLGSKSEASKA